MYCHILYTQLRSEHLQCIVKLLAWLGDGQICAWLWDCVPLIGAKLQLLTLETLMNVFKTLLSSGCRRVITTRCMVLLPGECWLELWVILLVETIAL